MENITRIFNECHVIVKTNGVLKDFAVDVDLFPKSNKEVLDSLNLPDGEIVSRERVKVGRYMSVNEFKELADKGKPKSPRGLIIRSFDRYHALILDKDGNKELFPLSEEDAYQSDDFILEAYRVEKGHDGLKVLDRNHTKDFYSMSVDKFIKLSNVGTVSHYGKNFVVKPNHD